MQDQDYPTREIAIPSNRIGNLPVYAYGFSPGRDHETIQRHAVRPDPRKAPRMSNAMPDYLSRELVCHNYPAGEPPPSEVMQLLNRAAARQTYAERKALRAGSAPPAPVDFAQAGITEVEVIQAIRSLLTLTLERLIDAGPTRRDNALLDSLRQVEGQYNQMASALRENLKNYHGTSHEGSSGSCTIPQEQAPPARPSDQRTQGTPPPEWYHGPPPRPTN